MSMIETQAVAELVENFTRATLTNAKKYTNSEPLDESNIYDLHVLAARIYALGWEDGNRIASLNESHAYNRRRAADRATAKATYTNDDEGPSE